MKGFEERCRDASEILGQMADKARDHRYRELLYRLSLDTFCASVWIRNMRKFEFVAAQMFPKECEEVWRAVDEMKEEEEDG